MILITGDTHGDIERFKDKRLKKLRKSDALIICGDFGFIWDGSRRERRILKWLGRRRYNVLFVEGVHENFEQLSQYETEQWCGGLTRKISGNLRQLMRGQVFEIAGKRIFAFGGGKDDADSVHDGSDANYCVAPSEEEFSEADRRLEEVGEQVDYIVSYSPPKTLGEFLTGGESQADTVSAYLELKKETVRFSHWFFGKFHVNKRIPTRFTAVFDSVINSETLQ